MKRGLILLFFLGGFVVSGFAAPAEHHRATRLGNPATRFADPLQTPQDLRARFADPALRSDFIAVLRQWGWKGVVRDLFTAAQNAPIEEMAIPVGYTMPFMSSRENGEPVCLRNVLWAGEAPAPAYAFDFTSNGRRYRCITPKACSNFFLEDLGDELVPKIALRCVAPAQLPLGRPLKVCLVVSNPGNGAVAQGSARLAIPAGLAYESASAGGREENGSVVWHFTNLPAQSSNELCVVFRPETLGEYRFASRVSGSSVNAASECATTVFGIPAILIDAIDLADPIQVGENATYEIRVTNQGSTEGTNVKLVFNLPPNGQFVSGGGITPIRATAASIETEPLPVLAPKAQAVWQVVMKALAPGDVRFKIELSSDQFAKPIFEEESTLLY